MKKCAVWMVLLLACLALNVCALAEIPKEYENCLYPVRVHGLWGYMNYAGEVVIEPQWENAGEFRGAGYAVVGNGKEGIIDRTGAYVVEPAYSCEEDYDGRYYGGKDTGVIWVLESENLGGFFDVASGCFSGIRYDPYFVEVGGGRLISVREPGNTETWRSMGFADRTTGELVIPYQYGMPDSALFQEGFAYVERYASPDTEDFTPLIINERNEVLPLPEGIAPFYRAVFSGGRLQVYDTQTELCGYADTQGKLVIPAVYENVEAFSGGVALVTLGDEKYYIDRDGRPAQAPRAKGPSLFFGECSYFLAPCGIKDENGEILVPLEAGYQSGDSFVYEFYDHFTEGLQALERDGKYGFLDTRGREALPFVWDYAENFSNGLALVEQDGEMMYIDHTGNVTWREE